jgi:hypothetical protein
MGSNRSKPVISLSISLSHTYKKVKDSTRCRIHGGVVKVSLVSLVHGSKRNHPIKEGRDQVVVVIERVCAKTNYAVLLFDFL